MYTWWQNKIRKRECVITAHSIVISHVLYSRTHSSWVSHQEGLTCNFNDFAIKLLATNQYREREGVSQGCVVTSGKLCLKLTVEKINRAGGVPPPVLKLVTKAWFHLWPFVMLTWPTVPTAWAWKLVNIHCFKIKAKWRKSRLVIRFLVSREIKRLSECLWFFFNLNFTELKVLQKL